MSLPACDPQLVPTRARFWIRNGAWLAAAAGGLCFLNSLAGGFVYDDLAVICDNPRIRSVADPDIWRGDWWQPVTADQDVQRRHRDRLYRPLTLWTVAVNYELGGLRPVGYHAFNAALHVVACLLVWRLAERLLGDQAVATVAALIFAVHPVHAEAVTEIVGRAEILAAIFIMLGLLALAPARGGVSWKRVALAGVAFLAALLSKESAVCYWAAGLVTMYATRSRWPARRSGWWWAAVVVALAVPMFIYLPLRWYALDGHLVREFAPSGVQNPLAWASLPQRWLHAYTIAGHYIRLMLVPSKLSCDYGYAVLDAQRGLEALTIAGILGALAALGALLGFRKKSGLWRQAALLTAIFLVSYAIISNTLLLIGVGVAERLMYWPSAPLAMLLALGVVHLRRRSADSQSLSAGSRRLLPVLGILLLAALGARTVVRNADWSSNLELFERDVLSYPESVKLHVAAAKELLEVVEPDPRARAGPAEFAAIDAHLRRALAIHPRSGEALQLLGREHAAGGDREGAIGYFEMATRVAPLDRASREVLARLRDESGEAQAALKAMGDQVATRPADAKLRLEYGKALLEGGHYRQALPELEEAARLDPESGAALAALGEAYAVLNEREKAETALTAAAERSPEDWQARVNLAGLLAAGGDLAGALQRAEEAARLAPERLEVRLSLAEALAINGRSSEALALFRQTRQDMGENHPLRQAVDARIREVQRGNP